MYEQFLYYWLLWIIFIIVTFFIHQSKQRSYILFWLLVIIISSPYQITVQTMQVSIVFFVMFFGSIVLFSFKSISFYRLFGTFTVMICYISLLLWEIITPVWFFMPSYFIITFIIVLLVHLLFHTLYEQVTVSLLGLALGQLMYELIVFSYHLNDEIGSEQFIIQVSFILLFQMLIYAFQSIIEQLSRMITHFLLK